MKTVFSFIVLFGCLLFCGFAQSTETRFDISEWESSRKISKVTDKYECILTERLYSLTIVPDVLQI